MALTACSVAVSAGDWSGQVVGVHDGDTVTVLRDGKGQKIRLVEIDAPELRQDYGAKSKQSLSDLCFGKTATVQDQGHDKYNRTLGRITCDGTDANLQQVRQGMAWFYTQYGHDPAIREAEAQARAARVGLWADSNPTPPWEYRHGGAATKAAESKPIKPAAEASDSGSSCGSKTTCGQMSSCAEAKHYLTDCGQSRLDRDHDGIPCESLCK